MVTTRAQEVSVNQVEGQQPDLAPSALPMPQIQEDQVTALAEEVRSLAAVVRNWQQQQMAAMALPLQSQPRPSSRAAAPPSQQSTRGRQPRREAQHHPRGAAKRRRSSPSHRSPRSPRHRTHERDAHSRHHSSSEHATSEESSIGERLHLRAEGHLERRYRRLEGPGRWFIHRPEVEYESRPPLSRRIMEEPVPSRFRLPQLEPYDGTSDPLDHLESYKVHMQVQGASDALLCIAFPATLRKAARAWYSRLPPRSISSFRQLERAFLAHFDACRKIPRVADSLFTLRQKKGEALRDFIARFKEAAMEVCHLDDSVATLALKRGLRPSRFTYSLDKKSPGSYAELLSRAQKYIRADEADSSRRETEKGP